jgi:hypothetical protein
MKLKTLSKKVINELLDKGCYIQYDSTQVYVVDTDQHTRLGAVRFDTYLGMIQNLKRISKNYWATIDLYTKK